jgi:hypothetical protein
MTLRLSMISEFPEGMKNSSQLIRFLRMKFAERLDDLQLDIEGIVFEAFAGSRQIERRKLQLEDSEGLVREVDKTELEDDKEQPQKCYSLSSEGRSLLTTVTLPAARPNEREVGNEHGFILINSR